MKVQKFSILLAVLLFASAASASPSAAPEADTPAATNTSAPETTAEPSPTPEPTVDLTGTAVAEDVQEAMLMASMIAPDMELVGYSTDAGELLFMQGETFDLVNNTPGTFLNQDLDAGGPVGNFVLSTDVVWDSETGYAGCGIIFRAQDNDIVTSEMAVFNAIRLSGFPGWDIELYNFGQYQANLVGDVRTSSAINQASGSSNHYVLVVDGSTVNVYANGTKLGTTNLKASMVEGLIGFSAWQESGVTTCSFSNTWIWGLP